jgi:hypothetical protein
LKSIIYEIFVGEKFKLCHFDVIASEEGVDNINADNERECLRFKLNENKETKFLDIGMLRMDGGEGRTVVFYPKGMLSYGT